MRLKSIVFLVLAYVLRAQAGDADPRFEGVAFSGNAWIRIGPDIIGFSKSAECSFYDGKRIHKVAIVDPLHLAKIQQFALELFENRLDLHPKEPVLAAVRNYYGIALYSSAKPEVGRLIVYFPLSPLTTGTNTVQFEKILEQYKTILREPNPKLDYNGGGISPLAPARAAEIVHPPALPKSDK